MPIISIIKYILETFDNLNLGKYNVIYFLLIILLWANPRRTLENIIIIIFEIESSFSATKKNKREDKKIKKYDMI